MNNQCPNCADGRLFFSPDGRFRDCDQCAHREGVALPQRTAADLLAEQRLLATAPRDGQRFAVAGIRALLSQGVGAVKAGDFDEAYHCLARVLRSDADNEQRATAWLWLSQVFADEKDKRICLEQALALNPGHGVARRGLAVLDGRLRPDEIVDPEQLAPTLSEDPVAVDAERFTCPRCAGHLNFAPDGSALACEFCDYTQTISEESGASNGRFGQGPFEQEFVAALATARGHLQPVQARTFQCKSCVIDFVLAAQTLSLTCPYCGSVYVTESAESHEIVPPHALIPFQLATNQIKAVLRNWFRQHGIVRPRLTRLSGVYTPVWTFDIGGELRWRGMVRRGNDWVWRQGSALIFVDDVLVSGEKRPLAVVSQALDSFDLTQLAAYNTRFLADWPAERYQIPLADASITARKKALKDLRRHPQRYVRGETVKDVRLDASAVFIESFKLALLPLWLAQYQAADQHFNVAINGQTGTVFGERPSGAVRSFFSRLLGTS